MLREPTDFFKNWKMGTPRGEKLKKNHSSHWPTQQRKLLIDKLLSVLNTHSEGQWVSYTEAGALWHTKASISSSCAGFAELSQAQSAPLAPTQAEQWHLQSTLIKNGLGGSAGTCRQNHQALILKILCLLLQWGDPFSQETQKAPWIFLLMSIQTEHGNEMWMNLPFALLMVLCRTCCMADTVFSHATCINTTYSGFSKISATYFIIT